MLKKSRKRPARNEAPAPSAPPAPSSSAPAREYAALGSDAPIAWPSASGRRVPVTGELSPHATAALKRMGITQ